MLRLTRRTFLQGSLASLGAAALYPSDLVDAGLMDSLFGRVGHATLPLTPNREFYITSYDITPSIQLTQWKLDVRGLCKNPLDLTYQEVLQRPRITMISTLECIGNPVGGYSIGTAEWEGVPLKWLLEEAEADPKSVDLVLHGMDGYSDSIPMSVAKGDGVLLAFKMNGVPLPPDHGYPIRLIVPGIYGMKNVKWIKALEVVSFDYKGHWQQEGWPDDAPVKLSSRIDLPGDRETISSPSYLVQGIAFSGITKVIKVEVSTNEGKSWNSAKILAPLSRFSWVHWNYQWTIPGAGEHTLMVRASNEDGLTQHVRNSAPSSATTEVHAITVLASL